METGKMKLALSAGALALSMALAGCGGGSSSGPVATGDESSDDETSTEVTCGTGTTLVGGVCVIPERDRANQDKAEALRDAISSGRGIGTDTDNPSVVWTLATDGAIPDNMRNVMPKFIGPTGSRIGLAKDSTTVAALGSWKGSDQSGKHSSGTSAMLRVYSNQEEPTRTSLTLAEIRSDSALFAADVTIVAGAYALILTPAASPNIAGDDFPAVGAGPKIYNSDSDRKIEGTYKGASGEYSCSGAVDTCSATAGTAGIDLDGVWKFKPDAGATIENKDPDYLQFGWWVHKDASGGATNADVFYALKGTTSGVLQTNANIVALSGGTATYKGYAAGKFAVYHPTQDIDESGHFTADAMLKATFGEGETGDSMTGTINNFKLNDGSENPNWSINLEKGAVDANGEFGKSTGGGTVWSIGDDSSDPSGYWEANLYKAAASNPTIPDTAAGTFHSAIGNTHQMRGAFGATHQPAQ